MTVKVYAGKNLDDLLKSVAAEKGVAVEELTYTVKEEKAGFLGIGGKVEAEVYCSKDIEAFLKAYLERFFENIEMQAEVTVENDDGFYRIQINAENNAVLIGDQNDWYDPERLPTEEWCEIYIPVDVFVENCGSGIICLTLNAPADGNADDINEVRFAGFELVKSAGVEIKVEEHENVVYTGTALSIPAASLVTEGGEPTEGAVSVQAYSLIAKTSVTKIENGYMPTSTAEKIVILYTYPTAETVRVELNLRVAGIPDGEILGALRHGARGEIEADVHGLGRLDLVAVGVSEVDVEGGEAVVGDRSRIELVGDRLNVLVGRDGVNMERGSIGKRALGSADAHLDAVLGGRLIARRRSHRACRHRDRRGHAHDRQGRDDHHGHQRGDPSQRRSSRYLHPPTSMPLERQCVHASLRAID